MNLRKSMSLLVTVALLLSVSVIGVVTLAMHYRTLGYGILVTYRLELPENPTVLDNVGARINTFTRVANTNLFTKSQLEKFNTRMQMVLGKQLLSFGGSMMVSTKTGHLYDLMDDTATTRAVRDRSIKGLIELNERLKAQGIPLLFGYAHTTLYQDDMLPDGITDDNNEVADEIVARLSEGGIPCLDSRELMRASGRPLNEIIYRTDAHWSIYSAFEMYSAMVDLLNEKSSVKADKSAADLNNFNVTILPNAHINDIGRRLGADFVRPDDFELIIPKFSTHIHKESHENKQMVPSDGAFEDVVLYQNTLPQNRGVPYGSCYNCYGQHIDLVTYHNPDAPEGTVLVVKDSFGAPTSSFMSLAVRDVIAVDLRKGTATIEDYVARYNPDAVVIVQGQQMMRDQNFVFVD